MIGIKIERPKDCQHEFVPTTQRGTTDGVMCKFCLIHLNIEELADLEIKREMYENKSTI